MSEPTTSDEPVEKAARALCNANRGLRQDKAAWYARAVLGAVADDLRRPLLQAMWDARNADVRFGADVVLKAVRALLAAHPDTASPVVLDRDAIAKEFLKHSWEPGCLRCCGVSVTTGPDYRAHLADAVCALPGVRTEAEVRAAWIADQAPAVESAYEAVYDVIRAYGDRMPSSPVARNALIWCAVSEFLDSLRSSAGAS